jgi:hypothetical protein
MKAVFADAVYLLALVNPADQLHRSAARLSRENLGAMVTTEFVLTEVGDAMSRPANRTRRRNGGTGFGGSAHLRSAL